MLSHLSLFGHPSILTAITSGSDETAYRANVARVCLLSAPSIDQSLLLARRLLSREGNEGGNRASRGVFPLLKFYLPIWMADPQVTFYDVSEQ